MRLPMSLATRNIVRRRTSSSCSSWRSGCASGCCPSSDRTPAAAQGDGAGGDVTFAVDAIAEARAGGVRRRARAADGASTPRTAGWSPAPDATHVLVVDPIDGTRPAMAGLESACVAVALAPLGDGEPTMADVEVGVRGRDQVRRLVSGRPRRRGARRRRPRGAESDTDVRRMFWAYGFRGRPARPTVEVLGELIDASSVGGGTFELGSQAFAMTRIVTGQLDAVIEVGSRLVDEVPGMRDASSSASAAARCSTTRRTTSRRRGCACARRAASSPTAGAAARPPPPARVRPRVPDVVDLGRQPPSCTRSSCAAIDARHRHG